ncbi:MAG: hydrogenase maturation protease [Planctomycetaceae bacterium]|nr:hydrogenase maturation protease [Planctomycetaceae bacterium]
MTQANILVAGIGNIFLGDDGFGVEVVQQLKRRQIPESVQVIDFGIRGLDLGYALMEDRDGVILIDATLRGGEPGSLYVLEPHLDELPDGEPQALTIEAHSMVPERVLRWVKACKGALPPVRIVGCEPFHLPDADEILHGLSPPVSRVVPNAVELVLFCIEEFQKQGSPQNPVHSHPLKPVNNLPKDS